MPGESTDDTSVMLASYQFLFELGSDALEALTFDFCERLSMLSSSGS